MDKTELEKLHTDLLNSWNKQDATTMASFFTDNGISIGFDGSQYYGKNEIDTEIGKIFNHHQTADYVWKVKEVRFLSSEVAILRAIAGMIPPGQKDINPAANAIQTIIAIKKDDDWKIDLFQNTPAQFHGRPEMVEELTKELAEQIRK
ncbi:SgcJ/EcaC family oxidoreductase [Algoriphagus resistens]|uniref:SgcJ/EcaC family oxidoreductase n=1 Tax=Algoriphagus resistens TaxID=1750590 RepID=UPI000716A04E|nr:SgcJ/EcaC family oxidoreductase [Algoriphagus resistens]